MWGVTDGASKGNLRLGGSRFVFCDPRSQIIWVICGLVGSYDSTKDETIGLLMGLRELKKMRDCGSIVEGDSFTSIRRSKGNGGGCSWKLSHFVNEMREISSMLGIQLDHVIRTQNCMADKLANWWVGCSSIFMGSDMPDGLM